MAIMYGKIRLIPTSATTVSATIEGGDGTTRTVSVTQPCADVMLKAMEEYTIKVGTTVKATEILNCGRIIVVNV